MKATQAQTLHIVLTDLREERSKLRELAQNSWNAYVEAVAANLVESKEYHSGKYDAYMTAWGMINTIIESA